jgi:hypothetical protein
MSLAAPAAAIPCLDGRTKRENPDRWTPSYLAFVLPLRPEQVLRSDGPGADGESRQEWRWIDLAQRLTWLYGPTEALRRLNGAAEVQAVAA